MRLDRLSHRRDGHMLAIGHDNVLARIGSRLLHHLLRHRSRDRLERDEADARLADGRCHGHVRVCERLRHPRHRRLGILLRDHVRRQLLALHGSDLLGHHRHHRRGLCDLQGSHGVRRVEALLDERL